MVSILVQKKAIISRLFDFDQNMTDFLFEPLSLPCLRERPGILLDESWELETEDQILVRSALEIWNGQGQVFLRELLMGLSNQNFSRLIVAMNAHRGLKASCSLGQKYV